MQPKNGSGQIPTCVNNLQQLSCPYRSNQQRNYQFFDQYKKLHETTVNLSSQMKMLVKRKEDAWERLSKLQKRAEQFKDDIRGQPPERKKRSRRTAGQIQREFRCDSERCNKSYGTEGSLYQHVKLKHPEVYAEIKKKRILDPVSDSGSSHSDRNCSE